MTLQRSENVQRSAAGRIAFAAMSASAIEWYDFFIYASAAALVFGPQFFPGTSTTAGVLASFATFAVGFVARPAGGVIAGHFGDKIGRKPMLVGSLLLMAGCTTLIGALPSYESIGIAAPAILIVLRICQGLAVGGQWGGAMLMATECAPPGKKGYYGSLVQLGVPLGMILGNGAFLTMASVLDGEQFQSWGWRIPFLLSAVFVFVGVFIHRAVDETPEFEEVERVLAAKKAAGRRSPVVEVLRNHFSTIVLSASGYLIVGAAFYVLVTGMLDFGTRVLGMSKIFMLSAVLISSAAMIIALPVSAIASDRIGRKPVFFMGAAGIGLWSFALFPMVETTVPVVVVLALVIAMVPLSMMYGPAAALFTELFPAHLRYSGASLGYQLSNVIGGGFAPFIMVVLLEKTGSSLSIAAYLAILSVVAVVCLRMLAVKYAQPAEQSA